MRRGLFVLAGLVLAAGLVAMLVGHLTPSHERVYSVDDVQSGLFHHPRQWVGRIVLVRGTATELDWETGQGTGRGLSCLPPHECSLPVPPGYASHVNLVADRLYRPRMGFPRIIRLRIQPAATNDLVMVLRRLPVVGSLLPSASQGLSAGLSHIYRIQTFGTGRQCLPHALWCDDAVLLSS